MVWCADCLFSSPPTCPRENVRQAKGCTITLFPEEKGLGLMGAWALLVLLPAGLWHSSGTASGDAVTGFCLCQDSTVFS